MKNKRIINKLITKKRECINFRECIRNIKNLFDMVSMINLSNTIRYVIEMSVILWERDRLAY